MEARLSQSHLRGGSGVASRARHCDKSPNLCRRYPIAPDQPQCDIHARLKAQCRFGRHHAASATLEKFEI
jgi:hypothetical protein